MASLESGSLCIDILLANGLPDSLVFDSFISSLDEQLAENEVK